MDMKAIIMVFMSSLGNLLGPTDLFPVPRSFGKQILLVSRLNLAMHNVLNNKTNLSSFILTDMSLFCTTLDIYFLNFSIST